MANSNSSAESSGSLVQSPRFVGICNHSRFYKNLFVRSVEGAIGLGGNCEEGRLSV